MKKILGVIFSLASFYGLFYILSVIADMHFYKGEVVSRFLNLPSWTILPNIFIVSIIFIALNIMVWWWCSK